jgi:hypothetical protein
METGGPREANPGIIRGTPVFIFSSALVSR